MMNIRRFGILLLSLSLAACAHQRPRHDDNQAYERRDGYEQAAIYGYVRSIEQVQGGEREPSGGGALVGGLIGGVVGNQMGKGTGRAAATLLGAFGGAIIGNEAERQGSQERQARRDVFHVLVRLDNRREQWFDFDRVDDLRVGDRVRVVNGRLQRV